MSPKIYSEKPRSVSKCYAALYRPGENLSDLFEVAHMLDEDAILVEVPELMALLIKYIKVPDHHPAYVDFEIVQSGHMLIYSELYHLIYTDTEKSFANTHDEVSNSASGFNRTRY